MPVRFLAGLGHQECIKGEGVILAFLRWVDGSRSLKRLGTLHQQQDAGVASACVQLAFLSLRAGQDLRPQRGAARI